jgi:hypothetical protein
MYRYLLPLTLLVQGFVLFLLSISWNAWPLLMLGGVCALASFFAFTSEEF